MFYSSILLAASAMSSLVAAQNFSYVNGSLYVVPNSVELSLRETWCRAETSTCPEICGTTSANTCDPDTLTYSCVCASGTTPNISQYQQTLPFYICQQWVVDCVAAYPNDATDQANCHAVTCGSKNASATTTTSSSSAAAAAATTAKTSSSSTSAAASSTTSAAASSSTAKSAAMALNIAASYGTGAVAAGMLAVFGLAL